MKNFEQISFIGLLTFLLFFLSLLLGFYLNEDLLNKGTFNDFHNTWGLVQALKENLNTDYSNNEWGSLHFPLHYIILSRINFLIEDKYFLRFFFCFLSALVPILFYLNLKVKFESVNKNVLLILASLIFILPTFRSCAIWANYQVTSLIFFLLSSLFFLKWIKEENYKKINLNVMLNLTFLALAVYCVQYYAIIYLYFMLIYFQKLEFKNFILISLLVFLFSLPGFFMIFYHPRAASVTFSSNIYNSLLINSSILGFWLIPIFAPLILNGKKFFENKKNFFIFSSIFFTLLVFIFSIYFDYNPKIGGGFFLKLSNLFFHNNILFYILSIVSFILLSYLSKEDKNNLLLILLLLFGFSAWYIFQKYFEPLFLILFFLYFNSKIPKEFLNQNKNLLFLVIYVILYMLSAQIYSFYNLVEVI